MKNSVVTATAALAASATAAPPRYGGHHPPGRPGGYPGHGPNADHWKLKKFTSLVAFGDSYTDDSRLGYFFANNGSAPPVGWVNPAVCLSPLSKSQCFLADRSVELHVRRWRKAVAAICCPILWRQCLQLRRIRRCLQ